jgi:hypothetical protein
MKNQTLGAEVAWIISLKRHVRPVDTGRVKDRRETTMNRQQRENELRTMLTTQRGKEELLAIMKKHAGIEEGNLPPFGSLLVQTVLSYEFPLENGQEAAGGDYPPDPKLAKKLEKTEPGDVKFSEPPGREAPGG